MLPRSNVAMVPYGLVVAGVPPAAAGVPPHAEAQVPPAAAVVAAPGVEDERGVHNLRSGHCIIAFATLSSALLLQKAPTPLSFILSTIVYLCTAQKRRTH